MDCVYFVVCDLIHLHEKSKYATCAYTYTSVLNETVTTHAIQQRYDSVCCDDTTDDDHARVHTDLSSC